MNLQSIGGTKYFVTITDEMTGHINAVPIKQKNEASKELINYIAWVECQTRNKVRNITMDGANSTDYAHGVTTLKKAGIDFSTTVPYTPA